MSPGVLLESLGRPWVPGPPFGLALAAQGSQKEREKEKGKQKNELISKHKIIKKINKKLSIFCSPGHFISFKNLNKKEEIKLKRFLFKHQIKKKFQYSLEWEKNQLAIWDNRSMLHQATPFKGNRIMHRITIY